MKSSFLAQILLPAVASLFFILAAPAATFTDDNWISMGGIPGTDGPVYAAVTDAAGNLYIGGSFSIAGGVFANNVAKWDGTNWSALGSGIEDGLVHALAVSGNELYAAGQFNTAGGNPATNIAKWNGSEWIALGSGIEGEWEQLPDWVPATVLALAVSGSDLYAGGWFSTAGGVATGGVAKWNGSGWSALGSGINRSGWTLAVSGGDLYVGTTPLQTNGIAKWDGTNWLVLDSSPGYIYGLAVLGNDLYAGGGRGVARWNGSNWLNIFREFCTEVFALAAAGNELYALTGNGCTVGTLNVVTKWNGTNWSNVGIIGGDEGDFVSALAVSGEIVFVGGWFGDVNGYVPAQNIARWNATNWSSVALGAEIAHGYDYYDPLVTTLAMSGNDVYAGGGFRVRNGNSNGNVAKWNGNGWTALGTGMRGAVRVLAVNGEDLYAGSDWWPAGDFPPDSFSAKWNGSGWSALGSGVNSSVFALAVAGNELYAGGSFTIPGNCIAKWNGTNWFALGSGMEGSGGAFDPLVVRALAVSGNNVYAGGSFVRAGGVPAYNIAKWNGTNWSALGSGLGGSYPEVRTLAVLGMDLYAGGYFTTAGGVPASYIARWDGTHWSALGLGLNAPVHALGVCGGDLFVGGGFTRATNNGGATIAVNGIAKWNGTNWSALGSGVGDYSYIRTLAVSGKDLYAGGEFITAGGKVSAYVARARISFTPDNLALQANSPGAQTNTLTFAGVPSFPYVVEYATNLIPTGSGWFTLSTNAPAANGVGTAIDPAASDPQRFYRVGFEE
ncbi:MAG: hypothetical protein KIS67_05090 [Verrucomicrobiae bacterium]|nr:hypothetical protein [Verrucomicrobiae bacterium]